MSLLFCFLLSFLYYYYFFFFSVVFFVLFFAFFLFKSSGLLHHLIFLSMYIIKFPFIYQSISPYTQSPSWLIFPLPLNTHKTKKTYTQHDIHPHIKRQKIHFRFTRHLKGNKNVLKTYNIFSVSSKILTVISGAVFYACNRLYTVSLFVLESLYFMNWWSAFLFLLFGQENNDDNIRKKWEQYETGNVREVT